VKEKKKVKVVVPPGVDTGMSLRIQGEGEPGLHGGPPGNLYIFIRVKPHPFFTRKGDDIFCEIPISFVQSALGDEIEVPTLKGPQKLKIPHSTWSYLSFKTSGSPSFRKRRKRRSDCKNYSKSAYRPYTTTKNAFRRV